ncbi:uncharacterized protein METZ01_LOCUS325759 [marine metagenome]|uniref:Uncharacterized protein n=1 Tax=marine metagenome TaxID=408172 RepID=A0A382PJS0_9ZZZZ
MFNELKEIWINAWQEIKYIWVCEWHKAKIEAWNERILRAEGKAHRDWQARQDAYLDRIAEADDAYDSYVGDNHPAHEKQ